MPFQSRSSLVQCPAWTKGDYSSRKPNWQRIPRQCVFSSQDIYVRPRDWPYASLCLYFHPRIQLRVYMRVRMCAEPCRKNSGLLMWVGAIGLGGLCVQLAGGWGWSVNRLRCSTWMGGTATSMRSSWVKGWDVWFADGASAVSYVLLDSSLYPC